MKVSILLWALLPALIATPGRAKELQLLFSHAAFSSQAEGPYIETYLKIYGTSARYARTPEGTWQATVRVTMLFKQGDKVVDFRKYNLVSAELKDTLRPPDFIDQQRIPLPFGAYHLDLSVADNNSNEKPITRTRPVTMEFDPIALAFSELQFVESFQATKNENILTKSGFDLIPYVADSFPSWVTEMCFYTELYNLDKKIGDKQDFLFRYYIESSKDPVIMDDFIKYQRQKSAKVNPLLVTMNITDLPSGNYNLVTEAVDRNNEVVVKRRTAFQRDNPGLQLKASDIKAIDITSTFAEKIITLDSLRFYLQSLNPIASMRQNQYIDQVVKTDNVLQMQKFLYGFWKTLNDGYPEEEWNAYKVQVLAIEEFYKTKVKHGYETDMGYTWLRYGTPNHVEDSKHEPNAVPYIIWKYYHIENQSNVQFVFTNPHLVGTEYFLAYSDARDNRFNTNVGQGMYSRTASFGTEGGYGSRFSSNFRK